MPQVRCPRCATVVDYAAGFQPICPACGFAGTGAPAPPAPGPSGGVAPAAPAAYAAAGQRAPPTLAIAILGLVLNLVLVPGVGSLVGGRTKEGVWQLALLAIGFVLIFTIFLIPVSVLCFVGSWVWGLVTGIQLVQAANAAAPAQPQPA